MRSNSVKLLLICLLLLFGVFYGVDMATRGMETFQGTRIGDFAGDEGQAEVSEETVALALPHAAAQAGASLGAGNISPAIAKDTLLNRLANKTGELLQIVAYHGMKEIVALFDRIVH